MVVPKPILFSLPTINDSLPTVSNSILRRDQDLTIHEDDWRQFEAVFQDYDDAINTELGDIQCIYEEKSKQAGEYLLFTEIHVRKRIPIPFPRPLNWADFISACGVSDFAAVNMSFLDSEGVIEGGFAIKVGEITFYGIRDSQGIGTLCLIPTDRPGFSQGQALSITKNFSMNRLFLIHWPNVRVLREKNILSYFTQK